MKFMHQNRIILPKTAEKTQSLFFTAVEANNEVDRLTYYA